MKCQFNLVQNMYQSMVAMRDNFDKTTRNEYEHQENKTLTYFANAFCLVKGKSRRSFETN